jgi:hypothetical protein
VGKLATFNRWGRQPMAWQPQPRHSCQAKRAEQVTIRMLIHEWLFLNLQAWPL